MAEKPNPTILLVLVGRCILSDGKSEGRVYYEVDPDDFEAGVVTLREGAPLERVYARTAAKDMGGSAGIVYRVETVPGVPKSRIYLHTAQYVGLWPDQEKRAEWQLSDHAVGQRIALMKEHRKSKRDDSVLECLAPIRDAYRRARGAQKSLMLARAVMYITRG